MSIHLAEKGISIIIPFANEKEEVLATIESIAQYSVDVEYEIILINDASNDDYLYEETLSTKERVRYYTNKSRLGVAACRDMGVRLSKYNIFLLLDAHMRFYSHDTLRKYIEVLDKRQDVVVCSQTENIAKKTPPKSKSYGAYVELFTQDSYILEPKWCKIDIAPELSIIEIPCVLGASYAAHKKFWIYIQGLEGLRSYGCDEVFISLKTWLSGGKCLLLKDICIGHLYRPKQPYIVAATNYVYNRILVAILLLPDSFIFNTLESLGKEYSGYIGLAFNLLYENRIAIQKDKEYYKKISKVHFRQFVDFNAQYLLQKPSNKGNIANSHSFHKINLQAENFTKEYGLVDGKMGLTMILYSSTSESDYQLYRQRADHLLSEISDYIACAKNVDISFTKGILGIAYALLYFVDKGYITRNIDDFLLSIDRIVFRQLDINGYDWSYDTGLMGKVFYCLMRVSYDKTIVMKQQLYFSALANLLKQRFILDHSCHKDKSEFSMLGFIFLYFMSTNELVISNILSLSSFYHLLFKNCNVTHSSLLEWITSQTHESIE